MHFFNIPFMNGFGFVVMIIFWALIIWAVVYGISRLSGSNQPGGSQDKKALDILDERYAKGEINKKDYRERRKELSGE